MSLSIRGYPWKACILDVVSSVEKGVEVALENWDQIVTEAIINARAKK